MIKRLLVALSGTPFTEAAVEHALELARLHDAEITGVTVTNIERLTNVGPIPVGAGAAAHELAEHRQVITAQRVEHAIENFERACSEGPSNFCIVREEGDPFEQLISLSRYHDLTIVGLRGLFEYGVVHNPDDYLIRLIREGVRPMLAVSRRYCSVRRALFAYDGSMAAAKTMKRFIQSRLWPDVQIKIVCMEREPKEAAELLEQAATYCRAHGYETETEALDGPPPDALLEHASQWGADLIALGSTARSRFLQFFLGDTALNLIRNAEIPLYLSQ